MIIGQTFLFLISQWNINSTIEGNQEKYIIFAYHNIRNALI